MIRERYAELVHRLARACREAYGSRLVTVAVFGSVGRGTPGPESDVDVLIVARGLPRGRLARVSEFGQVEKELEPLIARMRDEGVVTEISPVLKTPEEVEAGSLLFLDMIEDALVLHDESSFFRDRLRRLADRLQSLGARKIKMGGQWYWDLKPDLQPGEVFEI